MPTIVDGSAGIIAAPGGLTSAGSTGVGYTTGAGGTVTQATSKSTTVTLNTASGQITMNSATLLAGASVSFALINSLIAATDLLLVNPSANTANYRVHATGTQSGSGIINVTNISGSNLSDALVINFAIIKGATS
jgi:hypothetical protein